MKAAVYLKYGPPEVVQIKEIEKPAPGDNEVLVKIHASTVNRTDCGFRKPEYPIIIRPINGLIKPKKTVLGSEFAGEVEAVGKLVNSFKPGDKVFGLSTYKFGTHAEYICLPEKGSFSVMAPNVSFQEAAAVCDGAFLALNYIRKIDFTKTPKILINGASGSIGTACVQIARHFGAEITAICNTANMDLVRSLGATEVIDYLKEDFTKTNGKYDYIIDAVGKSSYFKCKKLLKVGGVYFSTELGFMMQNIFLSLFTPVFSSKRVKFPIPKDTKEDIVFIKTLMEEGRYRAVIDRTYPLGQIVEAYKYVETGQKTGNVVLTIVNTAQPDKVPESIIS